MPVDEHHQDRGPRRRHGQQPGAYPYRYLVGEHPPAAHVPFEPLDACGAFGIADGQDGQHGHADKVGLRPASGKQQRGRARDGEALDEKHVQAR